MIHILYVLLALLGLGLLVFIHELGHYIAARRQGMKVEVFSIGLGKPFVSWVRKGVKWQICPLLFGGYVRIAGMEKEGGKEPYEIKDGFYAKKPWARIKVSFAGPLINLLFALLLFTVIWLGGGREKPFQHFTRLIGSVDPSSELYQKGIRAGDELLQYNGESFDGYQDLIYAAIFNGRDAQLTGNKIDYFTDQKTPYTYTLTPYDSSFYRGMSVGVLELAKYLIYQKTSQDIFSSDHPMAKSGILPGDRLVWVNGEIIFSTNQLSRNLNENKVLLTIKRGEKIFLAKVPRISLNDLQFSPMEQLEIKDWQYAIRSRTKENKLLFIPYMIRSDLVVERAVPFVDVHSKLQLVLSKEKQRSTLPSTLESGDKILAVGGRRVNSELDFLRLVQDRNVQIIVKRGQKRTPISWKEADSIFETETPWEKLLPIITTIGTDAVQKESGPFYLLNPVTPIRASAFPFSKERKELQEKAIAEKRKEIEKLSDATEREVALAELEKYNNRLILGLSLIDRSVIYNPSPIALFGSVFREITLSLGALLGGHASPKQFAGPIWIVHIMQQSWGLGVKEAFFWLGAVSLNLGILNLLPIPVLDGGHICFSFLEMIRKKPLKAKTMRRMMIPFILLLVFFFFYLTYNDLIRLFGRFF